VGINDVFAGVPVADYESAVAWYERLFGRAPDFFPHDHEAVWQGAGNGWVYVVEDAERAGRALLTFLVDDLDEQLAGLAERGIEADPVDTLPGKVRRASITDTDGNKITFGQPLG
jgi:predicted enzyme related to lactoylglutathione lyase